MELDDRLSEFKQALIDVLEKEIEDFKSLSTTDYPLVAEANYRAGLAKALNIINKHLPDSEVSTPKHGSIDALRGSLQNCVNHLERAKRRSSSGAYDNAIEQANKTLYETLYDNEVSVPAEPTEAMIEAGANTIICFNFKDRMSEAYESKEIYKAMLQAHKGEGDE